MTEPTRNPRGDATLKQFARQIARLQREIRNLEAANQLSTASIEGGSLEVYDDDDVLRERIGRQKDGSYGRLTLEGPVPPVPSEPDVQVISDGVVAITWDGRSEEKWPFAEFRNVRVHLVETLDEACDRDNQVGSFHAARGGTIIAVTESDDDNPVYVRLVAVSTAGHLSAPSDAVLVDELDEDDLSDESDAEELEWEDGDGHTLTDADITAGTVTFGLSFIPEIESLLGWWHPGGLAYAGVPQAPGEDFTVDVEAATITWPLTGCEEVGDRLRVYYAHISAGSLVTILDWQSPGWSYLQVASGDTTDQSGVGFDDSAWAVAPAAFSKNTSGSHPYGYPAASSVWTTGTRLWVRRDDLDIPLDASAVTVSIRVDDSADVYWNGVLLGSCTSVIGADTLFEFNVTAWDPTGNVLAVRGTDSPAGDPSAPTNWTYLDASVTALRGMA